MGHDPESIIDDDDDDSFTLVRSSFSKSPNLQKLKKSRIIDSSDSEEEIKKSLQTKTSEELSLKMDSQNVQNSKFSSFDDDDDNWITIKKRVDENNKEVDENSSTLKKNESDCESPWFKNEIKSTPTKKKWTGPDPKLNLSPLGIDKELLPWIQSIKSHQTMSSLPVRYQS